MSDAERWLWRTWRAPTGVGAVPFAHLRLRLTLWYCGVLAAALLLAGLGLYFGLQRMLLGPIERDLAAFAAQLRWQWQGMPGSPCPLPILETVPQLPGQPSPAPSPRTTVPLMACFDRDGKLLTSRPGDSAGRAISASFVGGSLLQTALREGQAADIIDGGVEVGAVRRYALRVPDSSGQGALGVVQVGRSVEDELNALRLVRTLLSLLGVVTLVGAVGGGLFLSRRAMAPVRMAFARQQAFIADASHELRTPLALLRADAEVLLRGRDQLAAEDAVLLEDIVAEVTHMAALANSMLALARLDAGSQHLEHDVVDLNRLAAGLLRRMGPLANEQGVLLIAAQAPLTLVVGDHQLLEQGLLILLDNAVKFTPRGGSVTVDIQTVDGSARLAVSDTGIGIAAEHLPRLGERFYRVDKARSRAEGGTGLGLAIARSIAAAHGGSLTFASAPGVGTTATLILPAAQGSRA